MFPSLQDVRNIIVEICVNNGGMAEKDAENYIRHVKKLESAAAAKLAARQVSLTLAEADQKLRRFEVTQDLNDIAMFEMLYEKKIFDVENNDYKAWAGYKRASEPAFERYSASAQCSSVMCNR